MSVRPEEASPKIGVLFAVGEGEDNLLLSLTLEGFGYNVLPCQEEVQAQILMEVHDPEIAIVDSDLDRAEAVAHLVRAGGLSLAILGVKGAINIEADLWLPKNGPLDQALIGIRKLLSSPPRPTAGASFPVRSGRD